MKNWINAFGLAVLLLTVLACGGGGGGGGGVGPPPTGVNLSITSGNLAFGQQIGLSASVPGESSQTVLWSTTGGTITPTGQSTAVYTAPNTAGTFTVTATSAANPSKKGTATFTISSSSITLEPTESQVTPGGTVDFTATVVGASNTVTFTATGGSFTTLAPNRVRYTAPQATGTYTVTARSSTNKTATATVLVSSVVANTAQVNGKVVTDGTTNGISGVIVQFFNAQGVVVAQKTTGADGTFNAIVPITARRFHIASTSVSGAFYKAYTFNSVRYSMIIDTCTAPLPTLTQGAVVNLATNIEIPNSGGPPPPPPNGCS